MYYCRDCKNISDGKVERETFEPGYGLERLTCSFCGGENVEVARQCPVCGDYHKDEHKEGCAECREHIATGYTALLRDLESVSDSDRGMILEVMSSVFEDFYNNNI